MRVLMVGDAHDNDPGYVGEALLSRGAALQPLDRDDLPSWPGGAEAVAGGVDGHSPGRSAGLLLLLGSGRSVADPAQAPRVAAEVALIRGALDAGVPVLGICYGAQVLAHALGGSVAAAPTVELGWLSHQSLDTALCPPGPWLQFHEDAFTLPPRSRLLGSSAAGPQGMSWEGVTAVGAPVRALGWQFHPEVTRAILLDWLSSESAFVQRHGDPDALLADTERLGEHARRSAWALTDTALHWLGAARAAA
jgi:GMP synthase-like glutamine amidotransferase